jgi:hypothetical protein
LFFLGAPTLIFTALRAQIEALPIDNTDGAARFTSYRENRRML